MGNILLPQTKEKLIVPAYSRIVFLVRACRLAIFGGLFLESEQHPFGVLLFFASVVPVVDAA